MVLLYALLSLGTEPDPQWSASDMVRELGLDADEVTALAQQLAPGFMEIDQEVWIFHHNSNRYFGSAGIEVPDSPRSPRWDAYVQERMKGFFSNDPRGHANAMGSGLYFHQDTDLEFFGSNLLVVKLPKGARVLDQGLLISKLKVKGCSISFASFFGSKAGSCRHIMIAALRALKVDAVAYGHGVKYLVKGCKKLTPRSFILTNTHRLVPGRSVLGFVNSPEFRTPPSQVTLREDLEDMFTRSEEIKEKLWNCVHVQEVDELPPLDWDYPRSVECPDCKLPTPPLAVDNLTPVDRMLKRDQLRGRR